MKLAVLFCFLLKGRGTALETAHQLRAVHCRFVRSVLPTQQPRSPPAPRAPLREKAGEVYSNIPSLFTPRPTRQRLAVSFIFRAPILRSIPGYRNAVGRLQKVLSGGIHIQLTTCKQLIQLNLQQHLLLTLSFIVWGECCLPKPGIGVEIQYKQRVGARLAAQLDATELLPITTVHVNTV